MDYGGEEEEEYIEMEVSSSSSSSLHCCSSPQIREFEFQMCTTTSTSTPTTADHLFHKGKLLPLYLLPSAPTPTTTTAFAFEHMSYFSLPSTNTANTPLDSSPPESRRVSCDLLNSDDYFFEWSKELNTFTNHHTVHTTKVSSIWPKKLTLIKNSILAHKLRASKAYLKSLFNKSAAAANTKQQQKQTLPETAPYPTIAAIINNIERESVEDNYQNNHSNNVQRRSFSSAIKRHSPTKCLSSSSSNSSSGSSSFSLNSNGGGVHECLRRSSSATETEGSIEAAIAHCKNSQHFF